MTLYSANDMELYSEVVIVNDHSNLEGYSEYSTGLCDIGNNEFYIDATKGPAALTIALYDLSWSTQIILNRLHVYDQVNATLSVMSGAPNSLPANQLMQYNCTTIQSYLPQKFPLQLTTFVLSQGTATLDFTDFSLDWYNSFVHRRGYLMTHDFPSPSANPTITDHFYGRLVEYEYKFDLLRFDKVHNGNVNFTVVVNYDDSTPLSVPLSTFQNQPIHVTATNVNVYLNSSTTSSGTMISFEMNEASKTAATQSHLIGLQCGLGILSLQFLWML